jgi:hypothetical protein
MSEKYPNAVYRHDVSMPYTAAVKDPVAFREQVMQDGFAVMRKAIPAEVASNSAQMARKLLLARTPLSVARLAIKLSEQSGFVVPELFMPRPLQFRFWGEGKSIAKAAFGEFISAAQDAHQMLDSSPTSAQVKGSTTANNLNRISVNRVGAHKEFEPHQDKAHYVGTAVVGQLSKSIWFIHPGGPRPQDSEVQTFVTGPGDLVFLREAQNEPFETLTPLKDPEGLRENGSVVHSVYNPSPKNRYSLALFQG